jgi:hypothetical protein
MILENGKDSWHLSLHQRVLCLPVKAMQGAQNEPYSEGLVIETGKGSGL